MIKPKVLSLIHLPPPVHGAAIAGSYIKNSKYINDAVESTYINLATNRELSKSGKVSFEKIGILYSLIKNVIVTLRRSDFELCHMSLTASGPGFYKDCILVWVLKMFSVKILYHFNNKGVASASGNPVNRILYRYVFRNTQSVLLSPNLYKDISRYVTEDDVYYCPYGIPDTAKDYGRLENEKDTGRCIFLFLSNMIEEKGVYTLLEAAKLLKEHRDLFECHFVGGWSDITPELFENYVKLNDLAENTFAHGPKYGADKDAFFSKADVFVFPTFYHYETFGIVNLEAMQHRLPVISTSVGAIPDIIEEGVTGFIVPQRNPDALAEKMKEFIFQRELCKNFGLSGRKRYEELYTLDKFEKRLANILKNAAYSTRDKN